MKYSELIQLYFERSVALQWYWTLYVIVIGGVLALSNLRQRSEFATTLLVTILFACFAYKNLGAIEATLAERNATLSAIKSFPPVAWDGNDIRGVRDALEPTLQRQEFDGVRNFHVACAFMTIAVLWVKEWRRRREDKTLEKGAA